MCRSLVRALALGLLGSFVLLACTPRDGGFLERKDLFSLSLGKAENALDLFTTNGIRTLKKNRLFMRNGIFYISNGNSSKVMKFSSFGDLLGLVYNPQVNPVPVLLGEGSTGKLTNKLAFQYAFEEIGELAVQHDGTMLVEDWVPESQKIYDDKLGTTLNRLIIRFNGQGEYLDYLGQEGVGGTPFPCIEWIQTSLNDDITVLCKAPGAWLVYGFDRNGRRRYLLTLTPDTLPVPDEGAWTPSLAAIRPDPEGDQLFLQLNYYPRVDSSLRPDSRIQPVQSRLYRFSLHSQRYESWFELPYQTQKPGKQFNQESPTYQSLQLFLGVTAGTNLFFLNRKAEDLYQLVIFDAQGRNLASRLLQLEDSRILDLNIHLSSAGVISALCSLEDKVVVSWWRADALTGLSGETL